MRAGESVSRRCPALVTSAGGRPRLRRETSELVSAQYEISYFWSERCENAAEMVRRLYLASRRRPTFSIVRWAYRTVDIPLNHRLQSLLFVEGSCQSETSVHSLPIQMFNEGGLQ